MADSPNFLQFEFRVVKRSHLNFRDDNPWKLTKTEAARLRKLISAGNVGPINVNLRLAANGFGDDWDGKYMVIGGKHRVVKAMDELAGYGRLKDCDYDVPCAVVQVGPARESEIVVALNNRIAQGNWDSDLLASVLSQPGVDVHATGFTETELRGLIDSDVLDSILGIEHPEPIADMTDKIGDMSDFVPSSEPQGLDGEVSDDTQSHDGEQSRSDAPQLKPPPQRLYPLAIALDRQAINDWRAFKESLGVVRDTDAFLALVDGGVGYQTALTKGK